MRMGRNRIPRNAYGGPKERGRADMYPGMPGDCSGQYAVTLTLIHITV